jgi:hypothetical protein
MEWLDISVRVGQEPPRVCGSCKSSGWDREGRRTPAERLKSTVVAPVTAVVKPYKVIQPGERKFQKVGPVKD